MENIPTRSPRSLAAGATWTLQGWGAGQHCKRCTPVLARRRNYDEITSHRGGDARTAWSKAKLTFSEKYGSRGEALSGCGGREAT